MEHSTGERTANSKQWQSICEANGWEFYPNDGNGMPEAVTSLLKSRHANNPVFENRDLSEAEASKYGDLNELLHTRMTAAAREHFRDTPLPLEIKSQGDWAVEFAWKIGTPFTYQNLDWYGPTYECYIAVLESYVSSALVDRFQQQLRDELTDWRIVLGTADDSSFDAWEAIYMYSDRIIVWEGDIEHLTAPPAG